MRSSFLENDDNVPYGAFPMNREEVEMVEYFGLEEMLQKMQRWILPKQME